MQISVPPSTLAVILAVIIILAIILRLLSLRNRGRTGKAPRTARPARAARSPRAEKPTAAAKPAPAAKSSRRSPFPLRHAPAGSSDHGLAVAKKYGKESRSPEWPAVAHAHLLREPGCMVCGFEGHGLQVHHIKPFHLFPELELDPNNLITLCEIKNRDHHLLIGHLDDWESYNPEVRTDVKRYHKESSVQIRANPSWQKEELNRPNPHA